MIVVHKAQRFHATRCYQDAAHGTIERKSEMHIDRPWHIVRADTATWCMHLWEVFRSCLNAAVRMASRRSSSLEDRSCVAEICIAAGAGMDQAVHWTRLLDELSRILWTPTICWSDSSAQQMLPVARRYPSGFSGYTGSERYLGLTSA